MKSRQNERKLENEPCREAGINSDQDRHIIDRDTAIDGGVFFEEGATEAIHVDSGKYSKLMTLYEKCKKSASRNGVIRKQHVLMAVYDIVSKAMPTQSDTAVKRIIREYEVVTERKIALDIFLIEGVGLYRHYALACTALLELFKKDGILRGSPSIDHKRVGSGNHVWCRYTSSKGEVYILDAAKKYFGKLKNAPDEKKLIYNRPDDLSK